MEGTVQAEDGWEEPGKVSLELSEDLVIGRVWDEIRIKCSAVHCCQEEKKKTTLINNWDVQRKMAGSEREQPT